MAAEELRRLAGLDALGALVIYSGGDEVRFGVAYLFVLRSGVAWLDMNLGQSHSPYHVMYGSLEEDGVVVSGNPGVRAVRFFEVYPAEPLWADVLVWRSRTFKPTRERAWEVLAGDFGLRVADRLA